VLDVRRGAEIRRMKEVEGLSIHEIVRRTGHDRNTVRRALRREDPAALSASATAVEARFVHKPFSAWGEIFGDEVTAVATIDRLVRHAEILSLKGDSYRLQGKDLGAPARHD
jgi:hypothetical protein